MDTTDIVSRFHREGFVGIPQFLAGQDLEDMLRNVDRFVAEVAPGLHREHVFFEDKGDRATLKQIQKMHVHDAYLGRWMDSGPFRDLAEQLLDGPVVPINLQYFNKPAGIGKPTPPHQDGHYFMLKPCEAITMWLALDEVDEENGCVYYLPGSHVQGPREHARTTTLGFSQGIVDYGSEEERSREVAVHASPGDLLAHHAMTVHRANGNRSAHRSRRALGFVYFSHRARQDEEAHRAYQKKLKQEMLDAGLV